MMEANILVIDEESAICEFLKDALKTQQYVVSYASTAPEGIKAFSENSFDVVMVDLRLADIDIGSIKTLEKLKMIDPDSVIIISSYPSFEGQQVTSKLEVYDFVAKPLREDVFFLIKRAVNFRNLRLANKRLTKELMEQSSKLEEMVRERTRELNLLYQIGQDLLSTLKLDKVLEIIVDRVCVILNLEICSLLLLDGQTDELTIKVARGLDQEIIAQTKIKSGESISGWAVQNKEAILVDDIEKDPRFSRSNNEKYYTNSFICVPLIIKDKVIGVINVNNKKSRQPFTQEDFNFVKGIAAEAAIAVENARLYTSLEETYIRTIAALTSAINAKDHYTKTHSEHVTKYAAAIARKVGLSESHIEEIKYACQLHDLGKIGVPDHILTKPGKLSPEEWKEIKLHSLKSTEIVSPLVFLGDIISLVEQHHERYDGKGYPFGIKGEDIKLGARIMAVADSFDAMVTDRPYRKALSKEEAIAELKNNSGTQFDPKIVEVFLKILKQSSPG